MPSTDDQYPSRLTNQILAWLSESCGKPCRASDRVARQASTTFTGFVSDGIDQRTRMSDGAALENVRAPVARSRPAVKGDRPRWRHPGLIGLLCGSGLGVGFGQEVVAVAMGDRAVGVAPAQDGFLMSWWMVVHSSAIAWW
jgi:hypothetical protein